MSTQQIATSSWMSRPGVDRNSFWRHDLSPEHMTRPHQERKIESTVVSLSREGLVIRCAEVLAPGAIIRLNLPGSSAATARVVNSEADHYALEFVDSASARLVAGRTIDDLAGLTISPDSESFPEPDVARWPRFARGWFIVAVTAAGWAAIYWLCR
ncbi:PilZ domain-containing protein [Hephaestia mangrovi]|uniref:PilZ domain-containing protein n=1 Tax=Hephaestia mangrovi TaxID=2873268 RepID=UPI001CA75C47|nr:PilZ domain-containing protein [Hephaestia mangrovi]MBY8829729.1 PilZ domain-containing protein [Hephaestia mangrovi]